MIGEERNLPAPAVASKWRPDSRLQYTAVVYWQKFDPAEWHIEYDTNKLAVHGIEDREAAELIWNGFVARPNKRRHGADRYQLVGRTDEGRPLMLIVHLSANRRMRVITGWQL